jgi:hypothetical protein
MVVPFILLQGKIERNAESCSQMLGTEGEEDGTFLEPVCRFCLAIPEL